MYLSSPRSYSVRTQPKSAYFKKNKKNIFTTILKFRYRVYACIILTAIIPLLYASTPNLPQQAKPSFGFVSFGDNPLFSIVQRADEKPFTLAENVLLLLKNSNYFENTDEPDSLQNLEYLVDRLGLSAAEELESLSGAPLAEIEECPANPQQANFLRYPQYNINTPIIYSELTDLFNTNADGSINYQSPIEENIEDGPLSNPIQRLLVDGIVHIAFTAKPGEVGNSYIVGHSSNFSSVQSDYNFIFQPIERVSQPGEEFFIWDECGRELKFSVFETKSILENDVEEAYKIFPGRRVVTLQTSILEWVPGVGFYPTKRWLTRGELVID